MKEKYIINGEYKKNGFFITFHKKKIKHVFKKYSHVFLNRKNKLI